MMFGTTNIELRTEFYFGWERRKLYTCLWLERGKGSDRFEVLGGSRMEMRQSFGSLFQTCGSV